MSSLLEINTSFTSHIEGLAITDKFSLFKKLNGQHALQAELLADKSRLPEIYDFRLNVWEHSGKSEFVNRKLYPNGWYDQLDKLALHWVVLNSQNKIIASARLNIFHSLEEFPYYQSVKNFPLPEVMPFAFFSRLAVHPQYKQKGLSRQLFNSRASFCEERGIRWSQVFINNQIIINQYEKSGYKNIGNANVTYHPCSDSHQVNVFVKESNNF